MSKEKTTAGVVSPYEYVFEAYNLLYPWGFKYICVPKNVVSSCQKYIYQTTFVSL